MIKLKISLLIPIGVLLCITSTFAQAKKDLNIVFIGNSITYGAGCAVNYEPTVKGK